MHSKAAKINNTISNYQELPARHELMNTSFFSLKLIAQKKQDTYTTV